MAHDQTCSVPANSSSLQLCPGQCGTPASGSTGVAPTPTQTGSPGVAATPTVTNPNNTGQNVTLVNPLGAGTNIQTLLNQILGFVVEMGAIVVIFMLVYVGFLFVTARGNETKITAARAALLWTIVGALILLGAQVISIGIQSTVNALSGGTASSNSSVTNPSGNNTFTNVPKSTNGGTVGTNSGAGVNTITQPTIPASKPASSVAAASPMQAPKSTAAQKASTGASNGGTCSSLNNNGVTYQTSTSNPAMCDPTNSGCPGPSGGVTYTLQNGSCVPSNNGCPGGTFANDATGDCGGAGSSCATTGCSDDLECVNDTCVQPTGANGCSVDDPTCGGTVAPNNSSSVQYCSDGVTACPGNDCTQCPAASNNIQYCSDGVTACPGNDCTQCPSTDNGNGDNSGVDYGD